MTSLEIPAQTLQPRSSIFLAQSAANLSQIKNDASLTAPPFILGAVLLSITSMTTEFAIGASRSIIRLFVCFATYDIEDMKIASAISSTASQSSTLVRL